LAPKVDFSPYQPFAFVSHKNPTQKQSYTQKQKIEHLHYYIYEDFLLFKLGSTFRKSEFLNPKVLQASSHFKV